MSAIRRRSSARAAEALIARADSIAVAAWSARIERIRTSARSNWRRPSLESVITPVTRSS